MGLDRGNETTTQLLTLLNVSATKFGKRKWSSDDSRPKEKLNKRRVVFLDEPTAVAIVERTQDLEVEEEFSAMKSKEDQDDENKEEDDGDVQGSYLQSLLHTLFMLIHFA